MKFQPPFCYLNSNDNSGLLALGRVASFTLSSQEELPLLDAFLKAHAGKYVFGYLSFALQSHVTLEKCSDDRALPLAYFWVSSEVARIDAGNLRLVQGTDAKALCDCYAQITNATILKLPEFSPSLSKKKYLSSVNKIKKLIQRGDLYETNFCFNYSLKDCLLDEPFSLYRKVNERTKAPFSALLCLEEVWLACGSPERFLKKSGKVLYSQPIKGTAARHKDPSLDEQLKTQLHLSPKERSENIMIVDLVRNDLSKIAVPGSVNVDELCGMYSFASVHQMISTVSCELLPNTPFTDILKATFPMGSMTGAPKRNSLKFMNAMEPFKRELYSGSVGYFTPEGDFDFNVVIRSLEYLPKRHTLTCGVGSAITIYSDPEMEFEECQLKIDRLIR